MSDAEEWRAIPGYDGYEVSNLGAVRSRKRGAWRTRRLSPDRGYLRVSLSRDGVQRRFRVHQLVALAFLGPVPEGHEVRHIDGVRDHNVVTNLSYGTSAENRADAVAHGTHNMARKMHCKRGHEFTDANTTMIRLRTGSTARRCRACDNERARMRRVVAPKRKGTKS